MTTQQPDRTPVLFPVSRWLTGDMHELADKLDQNKKPKLYAPDHKKAGQKMQECYFGIGIRKAPGQTHWALKPADWDQTNPGVAYWGEVIWLTGNAAFPGLCNNAQGCITLPTFAWKIEDGDDTTPKGEKQVRNCDKPGHPGHWIVHLKTWKVPELYTQYGDSTIHDRSTVKRGYYIRVAGDVQGNAQTGKPGVYINHDKVAYVPTENEVELRGNGGVDAKSAFGSGGALPAGVTAAPLTPAAAAFAGGFPGAPGLPVPGALPRAGLPAGNAGLHTAQGIPAGVPAGLGAMGLPSVGVPGAQMAPPGFPAMPNGNATIAPTFPSSPVVAQPSPGFLQPPALALPPVVAAPVVPVLAPAVAAQGHTWASLQAAGYTLEQCKASGWVM